jgi:protein FRG1
MVKPLTFKGDKKPKKRKHREGEIDNHISSTARTDAASTLTLEAPQRRVEEELPDDQSWVSADVLTDIAGPVVFVLPSSPPTCISSDANGKVFASELENMIEADPRTAEPHDVRQVWVATKVAGTEGFGFKGHHGK